jgi:hypothetical protein
MSCGLLWTTSWSPAGGAWGAPAMQTALTARRRSEQRIVLGRLSFGLESFDERVTKRLAVEALNSRGAARRAEPDSLLW